MRVLTIILGLTVVFQSCGVVTLNENSVPGPELQDNINPDQEYPDSANEVKTFLSGTSTKQWQSGGFTIEGFTGFQPCRMDDQIVLNGDGTYEYDGGEVLCGAEDDSRSKSGSWSINFEDRILVLNEGTDNEFELIIDSVTSDEVFLSGSYFGLDIATKFTAL